MDRIWLKSIPLAPLNVMGELTRPPSPALNASQSPRKAAKTLPQ
jgi:hypothetical protein